MKKYILGLVLAASASSFAQVCSLDHGLTDVKSLVAVLECKLKSETVGAEITKGVITKSIPSSSRVCFVVADTMDGERSYSTAFYSDKSSLPNLKKYSYSMFKGYEDQYILNQDEILLKTVTYLKTSFLGKSKDIFKVNVKNLSNQESIMQISHDIGSTTLYHGEYICEKK
jgi:hypothetical protein